MFPNLSKLRFFDGLPTDAPGKEEQEPFNIFSKLNEDHLEAVVEKLRLAKLLLLKQLDKSLNKLADQRLEYIRPTLDRLKFPPFGLADPEMLSLQTLDLKEKLNQTNVEHFAAAVVIGALPLLKGLTLRIEVEGMKFLCAALTNGALPLLQTLNIEEMEVPSETMMEIEVPSQTMMEVFCEAIVNEKRPLPHLEVLTLKEFKIEFKGIASFSAALQKGALPLLQTLNIDNNVWNHDIDVDYFQPLINLPFRLTLGQTLSLQTLDLKVPLSPENTWFFAIAVDNGALPLLKELTISIEVKGMTRLCAALKNGALPLLQTFNLEEMEAPSKTMMEVFCEAIVERALPRLRVLSLKGFKFDESFWGFSDGVEGILIFCEALAKKALPFLRVLNLINCKFGVEQMKGFGVALLETEALQGLKELHLSFNDIETDDMRFFCEALEKKALPLLNTLHLDFIKMENIKVFCEALGGGALPYLRVLTLKGSNLEVEGMKVFCEALGKRQGLLQTLHLEDIKGGYQIPREEEVGDSKDTMCVFFEAIGNAPYPLQSLEVLTLKGYAFGVKGRKAFGEALGEKKALPLLNTLHLINSNFGVEGIKAFNKGLDEGKPSLLEVLTLDNLNLYNDGIELFITQAIQKMKLLKVLTIKSSIGDDTLSTFSKAISGEGERVLPELTTLNLAENQMFKNNAMTPFFKAIGEGALPALKEFHLPTTFVSTSLPSLGINASQLLSLRELSLSKKEMSVTSMRRFANIISIGGFPFLKMLDLHGNFFGSEGMQLFCDAMGKKETLPLLEKLDLSSIPFGNDGMNYFCDALRKLRRPTLKHLDINTNCDGSPLRITTFCTVLEKNALPNLKYLNIKNNSIDEEGMSSLAQLLGNAKVLVQLERVFLDTSISVKTASSWSGRTKIIEFY